MPLDTDSLLRRDRYSGETFGLCNDFEDPNKTKIATIPAVMPSQARALLSDFAKIVKRPFFYINSRCFDPAKRHYSWITAPAEATHAGDKESARSENRFR